MKKCNWKTWLKAAGIRALKTFCQTALGYLSAAAILSEVDWKTMVSAAVLAAIYSIITSVAGLPEVDCK